MKFQFVVTYEEPNDGRDGLLVIAQRNELLYALLANLGQSHCPPSEVKALPNGWPLPGTVIDPADCRLADPPKSARTWLMPIAGFGSLTPLHLVVLILNLAFFGFFLFSWLKTHAT